MKTKDNDDSKVSPFSKDIRSVMRLDPDTAIYRKDTNMKTKFNASNKRKQEGISALELIIYVVVFALVAMGAYIAYNKFMDGKRVQAAAQDLTDIAANTAQLYRVQGNFTGVTIQTLINNGIPDRSMVVGANIVDSWGQSIAVAASPAGESVTFTYPAVDVRDCSVFTRTIEGLFHTVSIDGVDVKNLQTGVPGQLSIPGMGTQCAASADNVAIAFSMSRQ